MKLIEKKIHFCKFHCYPDPGPGDSWGTIGFRMRFTDFLSWFLNESWFFRSWEENTGWAAARAGGSAGTGPEQAKPFSIQSLPGTTTVYAIQCCGSYSGSANPWSWNPGLDPGGLISTNLCIFWILPGFFILIENKMLSNTVASG